MGYRVDGSHPVKSKRNLYLQAGQGLSIAPSTVSQTIRCPDARVEFYPKGGDARCTVELRELPLRCIPERRCLLMQGIALAGEFNDPIADIGGDGFIVTKPSLSSMPTIFTHRRAFDVEPLGQHVNRRAFCFRKRGEDEKLPYAQTDRLQLRVVKTGDLSARSSHGVAVALIDPQGLVCRQHCLPFKSKPWRLRARYGRCESIRQP